MRRYTVAFTVEAEHDLAELYSYLAASASDRIAARYLERVIAFCAGFESFPERGPQYDSIRPGLRIASYRRRTTVAYSIQGQQVVIFGVFHRGRNYTASLRDRLGDLQGEPD